MTGFWCATTKDTNYAKLTAENAEITKNTRSATGFPTSLRSLCSLRLNICEICVARRTFRLRMKTSAISAWWPQALRLKSMTNLRIKNLEQIQSHRVFQLSQLSQSKKSTQEIRP